MWLLDSREIAEIVCRLILVYLLFYNQRAILNAQIPIHFHSSNQHNLLSSKNNSQKRPPSPPSPEQAVACTYEPAHFPHSNRDNRHADNIATRFEKGMMRSL